MNLESGFGFCNHHSSYRTTDSSIDNKNGTQRKHKEPRSVKKISKRFSDKTSMQGIAYIAQAGHAWTRIMWTTIFLAGLAIGIWQLVDIMKKYLSHPIATKISISYATLDFPSVTICNVNPLRESQLHLDPRMEEYIVRLRENWLESNYAGLDPKMGPGKEPETNPSGGGADPVSPTAGGGGSGPPPTTQSARRKKREIYGDFENLNMSAYDYTFEEFTDEDEEDEQEFGAGKVADKYKSDMLFEDLNGQIPRPRRLRMGHQANETILHCSFNGRKCSPDNFTTILDRKYGNCFQFNVPKTRPNGPLKSKDAGERHGLNLILYKQEVDYLRGFTQHSGFRLSIQPFKTMPFPSESGFSVSPGLDTNIGVRLVNITRLGKPFWNCQGNEEYLAAYRTKYSIETCINTCEDRLIANTCKCMRVSHYELLPIQNRSLPECRQDPDAKRCINGIKRNMTDSDMCKCKKACSEQDLELQPSYSIWPNPSVWRKMVDLVCANNPEGRDCDDIVSATKSGNDQQIRNALSTNFVSLKIYYVHLNFEQLDEVEDYGIATLGADVGGVLGLWLGISVFTLLELIDLFVQLAVYMCIMKPRGGTKVRDERYPQQRDAEEGTRARHRPQHNQDQRRQHNDGHRLRRF